jgi:hypothetical protein
MNVLTIVICYCLLAVCTYYSDLLLFVGSLGAINEEIAVPRHEWCHHIQN